jgi:hypothetical protein
MGINRTFQAVEGVVVTIQLRILFDITGMCTACTPPIHVKQGNPKPHSQRDKLRDAIPFFLLVLNSQ